MTDEADLSFPTSRCLQQISDCVRDNKRKRGLIGLSRQEHLGHHSYPSPPMSNPPSPGGNGRSRTSLHATATGASIHTTAPASPTRSVAQSPYLLSHDEIEARQDPNTSPPNLPSYQTPADHTSAFLPSDRPESAPVQVSPSYVQSIRLPLARPGRKSKAHVSTACSNCKRAHLSCDVNRPCNRCVTAGRQDSCVDVPHKKRGRPRLKEHHEIEVERAASDGQALASSSRGTVETTRRTLPATRPRQRRAYSSLTDVPFSKISPAPQTRPSFSSQGPPVPALQPLLRSSPRPPARDMPYLQEVPTAILDLDLVAVRANSSFVQIVTGGQEITGRPLGDLMLSADDGGFQAPRNSLREEREAIEPAYMPPIQRRQHDPVADINESDADRYTAGYNDRTHSCRPLSRFAGRLPASFAVRVRLAKATVFFVVVTLPNVPSEILVREQYSAPAGFWSLSPYHDHSAYRTSLQTSPADSLASRVQYDPYRPVQPPFPSPPRELRPGTARSYRPLQSYPPPQSYFPPQRYPAQAPNALPLYQQSMPQPAIFSYSSSQVTTATSNIPRPDLSQQPPSATMMAETIGVSPANMQRMQDPTAQSRAWGADAAAGGQDVQEDEHSDEAGSSRRKRRRTMMDIEDVVHRDEGSK